MHARDGAVIGTLALVRRMPVGTREMPRHVRDAFIATEDRRFRTHGGVDWRGVARAAWVNVRHLGVREGASTITMQLARLMFLGGGARDESLARKLLEVRYAGLLEAALSKEQILTHYLNTVYLGDGAFGVEAASRSYFGHGIAKATRAEAALLAGLAQAPSSYSPRSHPDRAARRQREVLARLVRDSVIDSVTAARITLDDVRLVDGGTTTALVRAPASWATEAARATVDSLRRATALPAWATDDALTLRTTIDARAQRAAERAVARGAAALDHRRAPWETPDATRRTQGALVALDPATGAIRAIVGGRRLERAAFDRARRARRSVGSAFKPFVYAAAMADTMTPATMVADTPVELTVGNDIWRPTNFGDDYAGPITLRDALAQSANAAAVRVAQQVGIAQVRTMAQRAGITATLPNVPALALGAAQLTPLELTAAYAVFANGGQRVTPLLVTRIEDAFGRTLWEAPSSPPRPALDPREAFLVQSLMRSVVDEGTARAVRAAGRSWPVSGLVATPPHRSRMVHRAGAMPRPCGRRSCSRGGTPPNATPRGAPPQGSSGVASISPPGSWPMTGVARAASNGSRQAPPPRARATRATRSARWRMSSPRCRSPRCRVPSRCRHVRRARRTTGSARCPRCCVATDCPPAKSSRARQRISTGCVRR
ncbi:MAG: transglycosylase domain-containing protein [Gemmatimonadaceae bacterium]|nr:transglycosylase domain-containing protein [Gemmatimonadaceae bacterium]